MKDNEGRKERDVAYVRMKKARRVCCGVPAGNDEGRVCRGA